MRYIISFCCFIISLTSLYAQRDLPLRIEFETAKDESDYHFANVGDNGCFIFYEGNVINKDSAAWLFMLYDTNLIKQKNISIPLPVQSQYISQYYDKNRLFILFQTKQKRKKNVTSLMVTIHLPPKEVAVMEFENFDYNNINQFFYLDKTVLFHEIKGKEHTLIFYNLNNQTVEAFSPPMETAYTIENIVIDSITQTLFITATFATDKYPHYYLFKTDFQGKIAATYPFPQVDNHFYLSTKASLIDSGGTLIIGTYNIVQNKNVANYHSGVYTLLLKNEKMATPSFYNFTQLTKSDTNRNKTNASLNLNVQLLIGDVATNDKEFVFVTEVFYPEYSQSGYNYIDPYTGFSPAVPTFIGYRFMNAYITTFDKNGKLIWYHYLPFENMLTTRLTNRVRIYFQNQQSVIYYPFLSELTYTTVAGYRVVDKLTSIPIETSRLNDEVEYTKKLTMENWYDNNFLIHGYQYIKNSTKRNKGKRYVFFINKLKYL